MRHDLQKKKASRIARQARPDAWRAAAGGHVTGIKREPSFAYLSRNLPEKAKGWEDLCFMRRTMSDLKDKA